MIVIFIYQGNLDIFLANELFGQIHSCKSSAYDHNFHPDIIYAKVTKKNGPRIEIQGRVLNPISYEKPALIRRTPCQAVFTLKSTVFKRFLFPCWEFFI